MMRADEQRLTVSAIVSLYTIDATSIGGGVHRFVPAARSDATLQWQGAAYRPIPIELAGIDYKTDGSVSRPTITMSRLDLPFVAAQLSVAHLRGAEVVRVRTLHRYLDGESEADPNRHWPPERWRIERLQRSTREQLIWQLSSPLDFDSLRLPGRQVLRNVCAWQYRIYIGRDEQFANQWDYKAALCPYTGDQFFDGLDIPVSDPALDRCSRRISGCRARFGRQPLPFGGFVGVGRSRPRR